MNETNGKDKRKALTIIIIAVIIVALIGIGSENSKKSKENSDIIKETEQVSTTEAEQNNELEESNQTTQQEDSLKNQDVVSIENTCIYNENNVSIYATGIEEGLLSYDIGIYIENNSTLNLGFNARAYGVNGVMTGNNIYEMDCDIAAGKKTNATINIDKSFLKDNNIDTIGYIDVLFWAYDNDQVFKSFDTGQVQIQTSNYSNTQANYVTGDTIYNQNGIKIDRIANDGDSATYAILNTTGNYFDFDVENITINDFTSSDIDYDLMSVITLNGCQSIFKIKPSDDFMSANGIGKIEKIEFSLNIRPLEDYMQEWKTELIGG